MTAKLLRPMLVIAALLVVAAAVPSRAVQAAPQLNVNVSINLFHDQLSPYGRWVDHATYGRVWVPRLVAADWRPYRQGQWVYTDAGWTWISEEPFGWATYHYGRWYRDRDVGWLWVPDDVWAPAWVAWRSNDNYVGWAPLPPDADVETDVDFEPEIDPGVFTFVQTRYLVEPRIVRYIEPPARSIVFVRQTVNVTHYSVVDMTIVNRGVPVDRVERFVGRPVPRLHLEDAPAANSARVLRDHVSIYRPAPMTRPLITQNATGRAAIAAPTHHWAADASKPAPTQDGRRQPPTDRPAPAYAPPARTNTPAPAGTNTPPPARTNTPPPAATSTPPPASSGGGTPSAGSAVTRPMTMPRAESREALTARQQRERQDLDKRHTQERNNLEKRLTAERAHPPANLSARELEARQTDERRQLQVRQQRELRDLQQRQAREAGGGGL